MDVEPSESKQAKVMQGPPIPARRRHRVRNICLGAAAVLFTLIIVVVILAFTVFKAKTPVNTINSVTLQDLSLSLDIVRFRVNLNVSVDVDLSVKNPNKVGFKYTNSSALLNYRGQLVGEAPIPAGEISASETVAMNLTLTVMADRLLSDSQLYSDVQAGALPLNALTKISGKVILLNMFKVHVDSSTSCDFTVYTSNRTVGDQHCKYKTKL